MPISNYSFFVEYLVISVSMLCTAAESAVDVVQLVVSSGDDVRGLIFDCLREFQQQLMECGAMHDSCGPCSCQYLFQMCAPASALPRHRRHTCAFF